MHPGTLAAVGDWIARCLSEVAVDVAFLEAPGLSAARGLTTQDLAEATVQRLLVGVPARTVVLADRTAVGHAAFARIAPLDAVDLVITDSGTDDEHAAEIERGGTPVVRA